MWYPELASKIRITLVEALPSVLPMFSKQLIAYTESAFKESKIDILTKTMVKQVCGGSVSSYDTYLDEKLTMHGYTGQGEERGA